MLKFSTEFTIEKINGEMEISEVYVIGERPWLPEALDSVMLQDEFRQYEEFIELGDGLYHIFVVGTTDWWIDHTPDGDEQDFSIETEYVSIFKMEQN